MGNLRTIARSFSDHEMQKGKRINIRHLINTLNYLNFQNSSVLINLKHRKYNNIISLKAVPQPCLESRLDCDWVEAAGLKRVLESYEFLHILISDGQKLILLKPGLKKITETRISFDLSGAFGYEVGSREVKRHACQGIQVELVQHSLKFHGHLLDFSAISFRVELSVTPPQTFQWVNPESTVVIIFKKGQDILYSGECRIIRQSSNQKTRTFTLRPVFDHMSRMKPKEFRSLRHKLTPLPTVFFKHPLTGKIITLKIEDLSGAGCAVEEYYDNSVLLSGMIIPELEIEFTNNFKFSCKAQVIYKNIHRTDEDNIYVRCGIAVLDMNTEDQARISSLLHQAMDEKSYVCNRVDLDDLWQFFFRVGFFYPKKYAFMYSNKDEFKNTYRKLYLDSPEIAKHFIYQDKGIIQGHISMLRAYENTWLFHHLAANGTSGTKAGLAVLDQIGQYVNDFSGMYSTHMHFIISFFRPENRFPNRVFGGFATHLNDPKGCSQDQFAFLIFRKSSHLWNTTGDHSREGEVELVRTHPEDLVELESFYEYESGGIMLHALDLVPDMLGNDNLGKVYAKYSLKRERHLFSLKKDGALKAVLIANVSDFGLNLSNLTNGIYALVLDPEDLSRDTLFLALSLLMKYYQQEEVPVLIYPATFATNQSIYYQTIYNLWTFCTQYSDHYLKYMKETVNGNRE